MEYLFLAALWVLWCALHSLLISVRVTSFLKERLGDGYRFTRLAFNVFALLSLVPVVAFGRTLGGDPLFRWEGWWRLGQAAMAGTSLWLFAAGARAYDLKQVLGVRQIVEHETERGITASGGIGTAGILGRVRHPWYGGAILILWARDLDGPALVANVVLTAYLVAGTLLEERKMILEFGEEYEEYRRKVPMLIPWRRARTGGGGR